MADDKSCHDSTHFDLELFCDDFEEEMLAQYENSSNNLSSTRDYVITPTVTRGKCHNYSTPATEVSCTPPIDDTSIRSGVETPSHILNGLSLYTPQHRQSGVTASTPSSSSVAFEPIPLRPEPFLNSTSNIHQEHSNSNNNEFAFIQGPPVARSSLQNGSAFLPFPLSPIRRSPSNSGESKDVPPEGKQQKKASRACTRTKKRRVVKEVSNPTATPYSAQKPNKATSSANISQVSTTKKSPRSYVKVGGADVLFGRGGGSNNHPGNKKYLKKVRERAIEYANANAKQDKSAQKKITEEVISFMQCKGRFLNQDKDTKRWYVADARKVYTKVRQALYDQGNRQSREDSDGSGNKQDL